MFIFFMLLSKLDCMLFFELFIPLLGYANAFDGMNKRRPIDQARNILFADPCILAEYVTKNPHKLISEHLKIVSGWQNCIRGSFVLLKELKLSTIFLQLARKKNPVAYEVVGLNDPPVDLAEGLGRIVNQVTLLPFKNVIIWDGLFSAGPFCGSNYMRGFNEEYQNLKKEGRVVKFITE